jgi:hypothetical protein
MKSTKQVLLVLFTVCVAAGVLAGCASKGDGTSARIKLGSEVQTVTVEHKGTGLGIDELPQWVSEYMNTGAAGVEALTVYKGKYAIIAEEYGPALQQLLTWVNNFNAQQQIGATINTRVASVFKANESKLPESEDSVRKYDNAINTLVSASYTGARKESDWWIKQRISEKGKAAETRYRALVLYTMDKKILDEQISQQLAQMKDGNPDLTDAFDAITAQILEKGLEWSQN